MNLVRWVATVVVVMAGLTALGGCGGASSTADSGTISKAEFIRKADAICKETDLAQKEKLAIYEKTHKVASADHSAQEKALVLAAFPPIGSEIEEVAALGTPAAGANRLKAILNGWRSALQAIERKPDLVMGLGEGPFTKPDKLAGRYGFKDCAQAL
jgi:hypothetical protein